VRQRLVRTSRVCLAHNHPLPPFANSALKKNNTLHRFVVVIRVVILFHFQNKPCVAVATNKVPDAESNDTPSDSHLVGRRIEQARTQLAGPGQGQRSTCRASCEWQRTPSIGG
jgi:hypothetical protein